MRAMEGLSLAAEKVNLRDKASFFFHEGLTLVDAFVYGGFWLQTGDCGDT
ncbi:MAG: hypothetical protein N0A00_06875 [Candidatus Bathyarchaeota archaeon]|nr:hypothetical protein [Candidatus Bathyarchaeota archaeon]